MMLAALNQQVLTDTYLIIIAKKETEMSGRTLRQKSCTYKADCSKLIHTPVNIRTWEITVCPFFSNLLIVTVKGYSMDSWMIHFMKKISNLFIRNILVHYLEFFYLIIRVPSWSRKFQLWDWTHARSNNANNKLARSCASPWHALVLICATDWRERPRPSSPSADATPANNFSRSSTPPPLLLRHQGRVDDLHRRVRSPIPPSLCTRRNHPRPRPHCHGTNLRPPLVVAAGSFRRRCFAKDSTTSSWTPSRTLLSSRTPRSPSPSTSSAAGTSPMTSSRWAPPLLFFDRTIWISRAIIDHLPKG
jgi:hypothetical protein